MATDSNSPADRFVAVDSVSLRDYVDMRVMNLDGISQKRHDMVMSEIRRIDEVRHDARTAVNEQFRAVADGTHTATAALDKRLEGMNEFRQQMNDWAGKFISRADVENTVKYLNDRLSAAEQGIGLRVSREEMSVQQIAMGERVSSLEKFSNNMQGRMWVIAAVVVIMEVALRFLGH